MKHRGAETQRRERGGHGVVRSLAEKTEEGNGEENAEVAGKRRGRSFAQEDQEEVDE